MTLAMTSEATGRPGPSTGPPFGAVAAAMAVSLLGVLTVIWVIRRRPR